MSARFGFDDITVNRAHHAAASSEILRIVRSFFGRAKKHHQRVGKKTEEGQRVLYGERKLWNGRRRELEKKCVCAALRCAAESDAQDELF
jgi:hypothetical protein